MNEECSVIVRAGAGYYRYTSKPSNCQLKAVVERDGRWCCKRHDPAKLKPARRADERDA